MLRFSNVIRGRILVIDGDEWVALLLARVLEEKGYVVDVCGDAKTGFSKACDTVPDAIVCSLELPDIDGLWVVRRLRTEGGPIAKAPIVLVGELADREARLQGFHVGADAVLEKPVTNEEVVAQVDALIAMSKRMSTSRESLDESAPSLAAAFRGDLTAFPLASILMMLEMERRTGTLEVVSGDGKRAMLVLTTGLFATTEVDGAPMVALEALREVLSWRTGRFAFRPREVGSLPPPRGSVGALVLEAMRLEDERKHRAS